MVDTVRTLSALQTLLADNTTQQISAQDVRDFLVSVYPKWEASTPTWGSTIGSTDIGSGTLSGRLLQVGTGTGSLVIYSVSMQLAADSSIGTGEWTFTLPIEATSTGFVGSALAWEDGVYKNEGIAWLMNTTTLQLVSGVPGSPGTPAADWGGSPQPFGWGTNDIMRFTISYEAS